MIEINLFDKTFDYFIKSNNYYSMQNVNKYIDYFFFILKMKLHVVILLITLIIILILLNK